MSPPVVGAILGFIFGTITLLRNLMVGDVAPLRVIYDSIKLLGKYDFPNACNIAGTMTQLFEIAQEECSILYFWTYIAATVALTGWSTIFMWILSS
ncbi:hypothetical protein F511_35440 [Dorcoceras hygrometricum]|uniref:Uncharacterized protein n=1 Tax=Dorcoceras hygrometricum TaxID=472368 RepID=A0A2Z7CWL4_9LAMI|nr:hypothetical protein F511_35440 [Dorcoceras hygrometricum]